MNNTTLSDIIRQGCESDTRFLDTCADLYTEIAALSEKLGNHENATHCVEEAISCRNQAQEFWMKARQPIVIDEEEEEEEHDEALDRADLFLDSIRADVDEDRRADMAEAIMDDLNGEYDPTSRLDLDEGVMISRTKTINLPVYEDEEVAIH